MFSVKVILGEKNLHFVVHHLIMRQNIMNQILQKEKTI